MQFGLVAQGTGNQRSAVGEEPQLQSLEAFSPAGIQVALDGYFVIVHDYTSQTFCYLSRLSKAQGTKKDNTEDHICDQGQGFLNGTSRSTLALYASYSLPKAFVSWFSSLPMKIMTPTYKKTEATK